MSFHLTSSLSNNSIPITKSEELDQSNRLKKSNFFLKNDKRSILFKTAAVAFLIFNSYLISTTFLNSFESHNNTINIYQKPIINITNESFSDICLKGSYETSYDNILLKIPQFTDVKSESADKIELQGEDSNHINTQFYHRELNDNDVDFFLKNIDGLRDIEFVKALIDAGLITKHIENINIFFHRSEPKIALLLLEAGVDVNARDSKGGTALHRIWPDRLEIIDAIIAKGGNLEAVNNEGLTPLHLAVKEGYPEKIKKLLASGAKIDIVDKSGNSPLFTAIASPYWSSNEVISLLIKAGANPNSKNAFGNTLLHHAVNMNNLEKVHTLLSLGANVELINENGLSAFDIATMLPNRESIRNALLEKGSESLPWMTKILTHSWELKGSSRINGIKVDHEGFRSSSSTTYMIETINNFKNTYPELTENHFNNINEALEDAVLYFFDSITENRLIRKHREGKPIIINLSLMDNGMGHAISIVIQDNVLMICNKGAGSKKPIEVYEIDKNLLTSEILNELKHLSKERSLSDFFSLLESDSNENLLQRLQAKSDSAICQWIESRKHDSTQQKVGNCAWESPETSIDAALILAEARFKLENKGREIDAYKLFNSWQQYTKLETYFSYIKKYFDSDNKIPSEELLYFLTMNMKITSISAGIHWELDLQNRYDEISNMYEHIISKEDTYVLNQMKMLAGVLNFAEQ